MNIFNRPKFYDIGKKDPPKPPVIAPAIKQAAEWVGDSLTVVDQKQELMKQALKIMNDKTAYTPDLYYLEHLRYNHVLIVDDMQWGHPLHKILQQPDVIRFGPAFTRRPYTMAKIKNGGQSYPIPIQTEKAWMQCGVDRYPYVPIRGELYCVPARVICQMDVLRANGGVFNRERIGILYPHIPRVCFRGDRGQAWYPERPQEWKDTAWMYEGDPKYWNRTIDGGFHFGPVETYTPSRCFWKGLETYYHWTQQEYE